MENSSIVYLLKLYIILGCFLVAIFFGISFLVYKIRKHKGKPKRAISKKRWLTIAIFICYVTVVLGATMLSRGGGWYNINFQLFSSYREAWNHATYVEWRNIVLNILLFVPMGFLLPLISKHFYSTWKTYAMGFSLSACIEFLQFIGKLGVVEIDDILNNSLGTMIGFGILNLILYWKKRKERQGKREKYKIFVLQLPALFTVALLFGIFVLYQTQEFGNLYNDYYYKVSMKDIQLKLNVKAKKDRKSMPIYQLKIGTEEEMRKLANDLFQKLGISIDEDQTENYQEAISYYSEDENCYVWIDKKGMTTSYSDFSQMEEETSNKYSEKEVRTILKKYGIIVPEQAEFESIEQDGYYFRCNMQSVDDTVLDGEIRCEITKTGIVKSYNNNLHTYKKVKNVSMISEEEALEQLKEGKFNEKLYQEKIKTIEINDIAVRYILDTKGYFQPVYRFMGKINGETQSIMIPAIVQERYVS